MPGFGIEEKSAAVTSLFFFSFLLLVYAHAKH